LKLKDEINKETVLVIRG